MAPQPQVPRVFLLPKNATSTPFTIVTLPHPRTSVPTRFLLHESTGLHEITKIIPAASAPRSWLLAPTTTTSDSDSADTPWLGTGQTLSDATLYLTTPYDPLFLLLPHLLPLAPTATSALYRPLDDLLDALADGDTDGQYHWAAVLSVPRCRAVFEARVKAVCATTTPPTGAYRPEMERVMGVLKAKCEAMVGGGLPVSMETAVVRRGALGAAGGVVGVEGVVEGVEKLDVAADAAEKEKEKEKEKEDERLRHTLRVRTAAEFLGKTYLAAWHAEALVAFLGGSYDFEALERRVGEVKKARSEAAVLRSGDFAVAGGGRGRGGGGGGRGGAQEAKKRRKEEEDERRKKAAATASRAVKDLGKVNTKGMAKMTSFFKKKET